MLLGFAWLVISAAQSVFCGVVYGIAAKFPPTYMTATLSGQALTGVFTTVCRIAAQVLANDQYNSSTIYFYIGFASVFLSALLYYSLTLSVSNLQLHTLLQCDK